MRFVLTLLALAIGCLAATGSPAPAFGADFNVTSTMDAVDANPGDGVCASAAGECTLRAAIQETNALPGADTVQLPAGTLTLSIPGANEDASATGDLDVLDTVTMVGQQICPATPDSGPVKPCQPASTIDGGGLDRVLSVQSLAAATVSYVAIRNGITVNADAGGGIVNTGLLTLMDVTISGNTAATGGGGLFNRFGATALERVTINGNNAGQGGGIENFESGSVTIKESTISGNSAAYGAGISNFGGGSVVVASTTMVGNTASVEGGGISNVGQGTVRIANSTLTVSMAPTGAAVLNATLDIPDGPLNATDALGQPAAQATLDIQSSTLAANAATAGSGIHNGSTQAAATAGVVTVTNSIVGGLSQINNCAGPVTSLGHNIDSGGTCGFGASGDNANEDPLLLPLTNNGGPTLTHALLPDSPAIDAADNAACPVADQRGAPRPSDGDGDGIASCDIGAYELQAPLPATPTPSPAPTPTPKVLPDSGGSASARAGASVEAFGVALVGAIAGGGGLVFLRRRAR